MRAILSKKENAIPAFVPFLSFASDFVQELPRTRPRTPFSSSSPLSRITDRQKPKDSLWRRSKTIAPSSPTSSKDTTASRPRIQQPNRRPKALKSPQLQSCFVTVSRYSRPARTPRYRCCPRGQQENKKAPSNVRTAEPTKQQQKEKERKRNPNTLHPATSTSQHTQYARSKTQRTKAKHDSFRSSCLCAPPASVSAVFLSLVSRRSSLVFTSRLTHPLTQDVVFHFVFAVTHSLEVSSA